MKKCIALMLALLMVVGLAACGGNKQEEQPKQEATEQVNAPAETEAPATEAPTEAEENGAWGALTLEKSVENENGVNFFLINLPETYPADAGSARVAENSDGTMILVDAENGDSSPVVDALEDVLPAYAEQAMTNLGYHLSSRYAELELSIESQELVNANGYTFCKYEGTHTYTYKKDPGSSQFVAYAVELQNSGGYAFWIVFDRSEDQSNKDLIADHAYNMALTLQEK